MARKAGFRRNHKVIGEILKSDEAHAHLRGVAEDILAKMDDPEAFIEEYETDRAVVGIVVPADKQAKYGTATRAAQASSS